MHEIDSLAYLVHLLNTRSKHFLIKSKSFSNKRLFCNMNNLFPSINQFNLIQNNGMSKSSLNVISSPVYIYFILITQVGNNDNK